MPNIVKSLIQNKVVLYLGSRYLTYTIQFINSIYIAIILGPAYLAVWGFINLALQYFSQINLGIPTSLNVLLSINKTEEKRISILMNASLIIYLIWGAILLLTLIIFKVMNIEIGEKYNFSSYIVLTFFIALFTYFNTLFTNYFRIKNRLKEIMFFQSITPVMTLIVLLFIKDENMLLNYLLGVMLLGQILSTLVFLFKFKIKFVFKWEELRLSIKQLLSRGLFFFIYNASFYFIIISTRTIISSQYEKIDFGYFTFSFTLANTIMLLFDSFSFLIYPKIINRLNAAKEDEANKIISFVKKNYITIVHLAMYVCILIFPIVTILLPKYESTFKCFALCIMTVTFYTNCFIYSSVLVANHKEKTLSKIALISLSINLIIALFIANILHLSYEYVILATIIAYIIYNILLTYHSNKILNIRNNFRTIIFDNFSPLMFIPFLLCLFLILFDLDYIYQYGVLGLFIILNWKKLWNLKNAIKDIILNPQITNI